MPPDCAAPYAAARDRAVRRPRRRGRSRRGRLARRVRRRRRGGRPGRPRRAGRARRQRPGRLSARCRPSRSRSVDVGAVAVPVVDWFRVGTSAAWMLARVVWVPSLRSTFPAVWVPARAVSAAAWVACPVPPLPTASGSDAVAAPVSPRFVRAVDALARSLRLLALASASASARATRAVSSSAMSLWSST